jgi:hypothetical protein
VHIAPDPVAEHLVARLRTEEFGGNIRQWSSFLRQLGKHSLPADFVAALAACAEDEVYGANVPPPIRRQLKDLRSYPEHVEAAA